jgi:hypothetical protein
LPTLAIKDEWDAWRRFFQIFGAVAVSCGFALAAAIFWAMARQMVGG